MPSGIFTLKQQELALGQGAWSNQKPLAVDYLVVAGGGSGGSAQGGSGTGGGGGAGGVLQGSIGVASGSAITVTVGAGGAVQSTNSGLQGNTGSNSVFGAITSSGGGGGGGSVNNTIAFGVSGGSGGGGGRQAAGGLGGQGVANQGNAGGFAVYIAPAYGCGGGGGAGTVGLNGTGASGGNGGAGVASDISGTRTTYAGGGGAGAYNGEPAGAGGAGGGGAGSSLTSVVAGSGTANRGAGGGGGGATAGNGDGGAGNGGSGIVIISYPDTYAAPASTTGSPTVSTSGSGSVSFSGSNYLTYAANAAFGFGSGNYTIEAWVYGNFAGAYNTVFDNRVSSATGIAIYAGTSGTLSVADNSAIIISAGAISTNTWTHIAVVRNGNTITAYVNGSSVGTATDTRTYATSAGAVVAVNSSGSQGFTGQISNLRVVKGTAVYTSNFTPSTTPLTAIANTSLLLSSVSGSYLADSSTNSFTATATGTPTWNQLSPFATGLGYKNRVYTWTSSGSITF